jgi:HemK-related putative methylase
MNLKRCDGVYEPDDDSFLLMNIPEVSGRVIEIGCGSGIVGLSYAERGCDVTMTDISPEAAKCAKMNADSNDIDAEVLVGDLFSPIKGKFDYCLFNPPYLPSGEADDRSWTGGKKGNEITVQFLNSFRKYCRVAFFVESSISPIERDTFSDVMFKNVNELEYDFEEIRVVRAEGCHQ